MDAQQATSEISINVQGIYSWRAHYPSASDEDWRVHDDSAFLDEAHAVGGFASVDLTRCTALTLLYAGSVPVHTVHIPQGATPVFFRRRRIALNLADESSQLQGTVHCIGWKRSESDAVYLFVFEDGSTLLSNDLQAG